jgi:hypothetical protein
MRKRKYDRYLYLKEVKKLSVPPEYKKAFRTFQPKFGRTP